MGSGMDKLASTVYGQPQGDWIPWKKTVFKD